MRIAIFAGGDLGAVQTVKNIIQPDDFIIAADGGIHHCLNLDLRANLLIGDFDSIAPELLPKIDTLADQVQRFDPMKDETDLELALLFAKEQGADEVIVFGALGSRWDQTIASLMLPLHPNIIGLSVTFWQNQQRLFIVDDVREFYGEKGTLVSLIPIAGHAVGVRTRSLEYPLVYEHLYFGTTRGVSNIMLADTAEVSVQHGFLLVAVGAEN